MRRRPEEILKRVQKIEIATRKIVDSNLMAQYHTRFKGQGMQFSDFREYYPGDDIRHIDWKVTARTQNAHIKQFEEERDRTLYLIVDVSASGIFGSKDKTKQDVLIETCALLTFAAVKNNDRVGLIMFSDRIEKHIPAKKGRGHAMRIVSDLIGHEPLGRTTDLSVAIDFYLEIVKHTGIVILASDFLVKNLSQCLGKLARKHDPIALRVFDPKEQNMPELGFIDLEDNETGEVHFVNTKSKAFQKKYDDFFKVENEKLNKMFASHKVESIELNTNDDYFKSIVSHFRSRSRGRR